MTSRPKHRIAAVAYDGLSLFELASVMEVFGPALPTTLAGSYALEVASLERGPLRAEFGLKVVTQLGLAALASADTVIVPGWRSPEEAAPDALLDSLRNAYLRGARICSICSGAFVLGQAGLLDGLSATTHWKHAPDLSRQFPLVQVDARRLFIDNGQVVTAAGSAAGLDMLLHLIRRDHGQARANEVAQRLIMAPHRDGGQAQYMPTVARDPTRGRVAQAMEWALQNLHSDISVTSLARRAHVSIRTLQRAFSDAAGMPVYEWILQQRLDLARTLLVEHNLSMYEVAIRSGLGTEQSLRRQFRRVLGVSPSQYRRSFSCGGASEPNRSH